jgi:hypothetical protein
VDAEREAHGGAFCAAVGRGFRATPGFRPPPVHERVDVGGHGAARRRYAQERGQVSRHFLGILDQIFVMDDEARRVVLERAKGVGEPEACGVLAVEPLPLC